MARLISSPKPRRAPLPATPPPAPPAPAAPAAPAPVAVPGTTAASPSPDPDVEAERSLLHRSAGRAGTVLTSWRGVLTPGAYAPVRRRLLGE
ncbi:hypothetical protein [Rhodospirillum centenum]|uniref:Uncharacterized protein n=1 Tax=Rhodospirillum centenum (strain ATCC 51521 / SW) TaxID=414684 RepID=B6IWK6_RHOCS|nr:hypothetical protein [Rhodospirillum centenum]ACJ00680.1 hypothetical protein RC1_3319 [Rhodospirillum centenum SW]